MQTKPLIPVVFDKRRIIYSLRDEFLTDDAAPITSPRTAEPGPGILTFTENDGTFATSGGRLIWTAQSTPAWNAQMFASGALTRAAGLGLVYKEKLTTFGAASYIGFNADGGGAFANTENAFKQTSGSGLINAAVGLTDVPLFTAVINTDIEYALILRSSGAFYHYKSGSDWILEYVDGTKNTATLYPFLNSFSDAGELDYFRATQFQAPYNTDNGIASDQKDGVVAAGTTFTTQGQYNANKGDGHIEFEMDALPSAGQIEVEFRRQDADNKMRVTIDSAGAIDLDKEVATVVTQLATDAGPIANGDIIKIVSDGADINVLVNDVVTLTTAGGVFTTEAGCELESLGTAGVVKDIKTWPRQLIGGAAKLLNQIAR